MLIIMTRPCSRSEVGFQEEKGIAVFGSVAAEGFVKHNHDYSIIGDDDANARYDDEEQ